MNGKKEVFIPDSQRGVKARWTPDRKRRWVPGLPQIPEIPAGGLNSFLKGLYEEYGYTGLAAGLVVAFGIAAAPAIPALLNADVAHAAQAGKSLKVSKTPDQIPGRSPAEAKIDRAVKEPPYVGKASILEGPQSEGGIVQDLVEGVSQTFDSWAEAARTTIHTLGDAFNQWIQPKEIDSRFQPHPTSKDSHQTVASSMPPEPERQAVISSQEEEKPAATATPTAMKIQQEDVGLGGLEQDRERAGKEIIICSKNIHCDSSESLMFSDEAEGTFSVEITDLRGPFEHTPQDVMAISEELHLNLMERACALCEAVSNGDRVDWKNDPRMYRDLIIYTYSNVAERNPDGTVKKVWSMTDESVYSALAKYELEIDRNPILQEIFQDYIDGGAVDAFNRMTRETVPSSMFEGGKIPQIPRTVDGLMDKLVLIYAGGSGGFGYPETALVSSSAFGFLFPENPALNMYRDSAAWAIGKDASHELVHAIIQVHAVEGSEVVNNWGYDAPPREAVIHLLFDTFEDLGLRALGENTDNYFSYHLPVIYGVLEEARREGRIDQEPIAVMIQHLVTSRPFDIYDQVRNPNHPSLEELFAYPHPDEMPPELREEVKRLIGEYYDDFTGSYTRFLH